MNEIEWFCEYCGGAIVSGQDGHVYTRREDQARFRRETDEHAERFPRKGRLGVITGESLMAMPDPIHWHVAHLDCDPDPDGADYFIGVDQVRSFRGVVEWTAHLMGKNWLADTDWSSLIGRLAREGSNGPRP